MDTTPPTVAEVKEEAFTLLARNLASYHCSWEQMYHFQPESYKINQPSDISYEINKIQHFVYKKVLALF
jgi:hypothetical protein